MVNDQLVRRKIYGRTPKTSNRIVSFFYGRGDAHRNLKLAIWAYFFLLILEGGLRKWVLPQFSAPLLLIRDPIAIYAIFYSIRTHIFPKNILLYLMILVGITSFAIALLAGHGNVLVALYGTRILLLHFPLVFIIGRVLTREDVRKYGIMTLWISIPMIVLVALQFYSPQTALVNKGVGDETGAGFTGALGFFRPPGTFSFTNGNTLFFSFVAPFLFYFLIESKGVSKILLLAASIGLIAAIPLSISRSLFFQIGLSLIFLLVAVSRRPKYLGRTIAAGLVLVVVILTLSQVSYFNIGLEAFTTRFETANKAEGGLEGVFLDRVLGGIIGAFTRNPDLPFFGAGIGYGTNVASILLTGERSFLITEGEWGRIIGELGLLLGVTVIFIRVAFVVKMGKQSYQKLVKGDLLPWLLMSFVLIVVSQGLWAQPTALGFSTLSGGLVLASLNSGQRLPGNYTKRKILNPANRMPGRKVYKTGQ